jgi:hypothetical protein
MRRLGAVLLLLSATAAAGAAPTIPQLFGGGVSVNARFKQPFAAADFDGDGKADSLYVVSLAAGLPGRDVSVIDRLFGSGAARGPRKIALAFAMGNGRKFIVSDGDFFATPVWSQTPPPLGIARRGSAQFDSFKAQEKRITNDIAVLGTEAGIDVALYWNGRIFALFEPREEP